MGCFITDVRGPYNMEKEEFQKKYREHIIVGAEEIRK